MKILSAVAAIIFLIAVVATAETANDLSDAEIQGRQLARQLLETQPTESSTNSGTLNVRDDPKSQHSPGMMWCETVVTSTNWQTTYYCKYLLDNENEAPETLIIIHTPNASNQYFYATNQVDSQDFKYQSVKTGTNILLELQFQPKLKLVPPEAAESLAFCGSDFLAGDLGLEFFHWPEQKILKRENSRTRICKVLESTNPNPSTNGYSRVDSWIDEESLGIVQAYAYDANGKKLKEFYPKDFKNVDGQWQVGMMEMDNVQTGSRSRIEFDLKK